MPIFRSAPALAWVFAAGIVAAAQPPPPPEFETLCAGCHGVDGGGGDRAPALIDNAHLQRFEVAQIKQVIRQGLPGGMPAFSLDPGVLDSLTDWLRLQNASASAATPSSGDVEAGERFFFGQGQCGTCHMVRGRGATNGPDLSDVAARSSLQAMRATLDDPSAQMGTRSAANCPSWSFCPDNTWGVVQVERSDGTIVRGFVRGEGEHDLQLQTFDGRFHLLIEGEYRRVTHEQRSYMPALKASSRERRDLLAYLQTLDGSTPASLPDATPPTKQDIDRILHPKRGEWPTYDGTLFGNRYSPLQQINTSNVADLRPQWSFAPGGVGLETTPLVSDGVMYVTGAATVCALDAATGRELWCTPRSAPHGRTAGETSSGGKPVGPNRGVALLGDQVFFTTDDASLVSLNRVTGAPLWSVPLTDAGFPGRYYTSAAPLIVGDLVIAGVGGGDAPLRGFIGAWHAASGVLAWRRWTIPLPGEALSETWRGRDLPTGGGATWATGSYDPQAHLLYWAVGNPYPATNGDERGGSNLYTASVLALDPQDGAVRWYFQFSPHDLHDWDANEPLVLADNVFRGRNRKLLLQANRNGFFYALDRITGEFLFATPFVKKLTWADGVDAHGVPRWLPNNEPTAEGVRTCPSVRGATNWYSSAFNPNTSLFYVMAVEDCSIYKKISRGYAGDPNPHDPGKRYLRAIDLSSGAIAWEKPLSGSQEGNYSGVLATAGNLIFHGETGGSFAAVDARSGKTLWIYRANEPWRASPMTYELRGRQYVAIMAGSHILSFALSTPQQGPALISKQPAAVFNTVHNTAPAASGGEER